MFGRRLLFADWSFIIVMVKAYCFTTSLASHSTLSILLVIETEILPLTEIQMRGC